MLINKQKALWGSIRIWSYVMYCGITITAGGAAAQNTSYNANSIPINGSQSVAVGFQTLFSNTTGYANTATGFQTMYWNTGGHSNSAYGYQALIFNTNGMYNTASGFKALHSNTVGFSNTAIGLQALYSNTTGNLNTANGSAALYHNTTGGANTANGSSALLYNTTGSANTANGYGALENNTIGSFNTANGFRALINNVTGKNNVALGDSAGFNSLGNGNIYIGKQAGANETGSNKFYLGNDATNTLMYGDMSTRQILLGNANPTGYTFKGNRTFNVLGGVLADSVRVALSTQWADYVFDDNYPLKPLEEVNQFIKANKHLPGIPSAAEVQANGIELGEMNAKLLAKIEELTLYMLQQQEQLKMQQKQIDVLMKLAGLGTK